MKTAVNTSPRADSDSPTADILRRSVELAEFARAEAAEMDFDAGFPVETFRRLAVAGLLEVNLPLDFGGHDLGIKAGTNRTLLHLLKHIGRGNLAAGRVFEGHVNALLLAAEYGDAGQIEQCAADCRNHKLFGVWNTEASDGVKIAPGANGKFRLAGAKTFASGAGFVTRPFVNAAFADGGWQMCIVPMEKVRTQIDKSWWQPLGMRSTRSFKIDFTGVEIEQKYLIGEPNQYYKQPWFSGGAIRFAAVQLGGAESLFDLTREYLRDLKRTEDSFQRQRLGEMAIRVESGNLWLDGAAHCLDAFLRDRTEENSRRFLAYANMMRTAIEQICVDVMQFCQRTVGARGLMRPLAFERVIRDLTIYLRQPAPDAALADAGRYVLETGAAAHEIWRR